MEYDRLIQKICDEEGIKLHFLSDKWVKVLEKDGQIHYIQGYKFDLNNHGIGNIMDDKGLFHDLLSFKKLPIIEHVNILNNYSKEEILKYFKKNNETLIVKGNIGTCGQEVFLVQNERDLFTTIDKLLAKQFSLSLCPYYDILNEYRVIVLNGEARIIYGKKRPEIIGDGKKTVYELACLFNSFYKMRKDVIINPDYIPLKDEKILLDYKFNLSNGAVMFLNIENELKKKIINLALQVAKEVNVVFGSIDIIYTKDHQLLVMEANSGVMMDRFIKQNKDNGYDTAYVLYRDAIRLMFKK